MNDPMVIILCINSFLAIATILYFRKIAENQKSGVFGRYKMQNMGYKWVKLWLSFQL